MANNPETYCTKWKYTHIPYSYAYKSNLRVNKFCPKIHFNIVVP